MPEYRQHINFNSSTLGIWKIQESHPDLSNKTVGIGFNVMEQSNFKSELKQKQWLAARCLIGSMNDEIKDISYNEHGAPFTDAGLFISLSHSFELVTVLLDPTYEVGVDIQRYNPKIKAIKQKFCSQSELNFVSGDMSFEKLHLIWSAKEAIYKQQKIPGLIFREQIEIEPFKIMDSGILKVTVLLGDSRSLVNVQYEILNDYTLAYTLNP